ncbi:unnamed protein product [Prorocentrum cordatum]|uniref:RING-type domain-containing protein n=1 Tax=Prorocentrum cordatum TaxID=2364126 RepID=A0ABN9XU82_9DINO|nr:unnamed protein product [Polarella glacialis]
MVRERLMRFSLQGEPCGICCEEFAAGQAVRLGCDHGWYCKECIRRFVEARLEAGSAGGIPCPSCGDKISEADLITLLPPKVCIRLHARAGEQQAVASGARACPTPNCTWRFHDCASDRQTCPVCEEESCLLCGAQPYHEGRTCEQYKAGLEDQDMFERWIEKTGSKQCPTCHMVTTKENLEKQSQQRVECHKMLCRNCNTRWCFKCLAVLTDTYTCGCTIDAHGFIDPETGKIVKHLKRGAKRKGS